MSHATNPASSQSKKPMIDWSVIVDRARKHLPLTIDTLITNRIKTPSDAATARTPESEEGKTIPLFIHTQYEVHELIRKARSHEKLAEEMDRMGSELVFTTSAAKNASLAAMYRSKATSLHLGIEAV